MSTIHLQGYGKHPAKPASELVPGETVVWNFGEKAVLQEVRPKGKSMLVLVFNVKGEPFVQNVNRNKLVAFRTAKASSGQPIAPPDIMQRFLDWFWK